MVSFTCNNCQDVVKKPKVPTHSAQCHSYSFTCVDCMATFDLESIRDHQTCVTETQKYQGKWQDKKRDVPSGEKKPRRPAMTFSDTDIDDDEPPTKKRQTEKPRHPAARLHAAETSDDEAPAPKKKAASPKHSAKASPRKASPKAAASPAAKAKKHMLPSPALGPKKATAAPAADLSVTVSLGSVDTVLDLAGNVLDAAGERSMAPKAVAKGLAEAYTKRFAKEIQRALQQSLQEDTRPATPHVALDATGSIKRV